MARGSGGGSGLTDVFLLVITAVAALLAIWFAYETWKPGGAASAYAQAKELSDRSDTARTQRDMDQFRVQNTFLCGVRRVGTQPEITLPPLEARLRDVRAQYQRLCSDGRRDRTRCSLAPAQEYCQLPPTLLDYNQKTTCNMSDAIKEHCVDGGDRRQCAIATNEYRNRWDRVQACRDNYGVTAPGSNRP